MAEGRQVAVANGTEKAKSEFLVAPMLLELRRLSGGAIHVFSGVEWNPDPSRRLNGYCDFLLTRGPSAALRAATPFAAVVEAKNDSIPSGFGQCIAAMVAAGWSNGRAGQPPRPVFGVVTNGTAWQVLRLDEKDLRIDCNQYSIDDLPRVAGVLKAIADAA